MSKPYVPRGWMGAGALAVLFAAGPLHAAAEPSDLVPGRPEASELDPRSGDRYRIDARPGRLLRVSVAQIDVDVALEWRGPDGRIERTDARSSGTELLFAAPGGNGPAELRVTAANDRAPGGRYSVRVDELADDDGRRAALRHQLAAQAAAGAGKERLAEALAEIRAARDAWAATGDAASAAYDTYQIGLWSTRVPDLAAAQTAFADAAQSFSELGMGADQALAQKLWGESLDAAGDFKAAEALWTATFPIEAALTPVDRVELHYDHGQVLKDLGRYQESIDAVRRAIGAFAELGVRSSELLARAELASIYVMRQDTIHALEELTRGVELSRDYERPDMEARFLQRLGVVYWDVGDDDAAAEQWRRALELHRGAGNTIGAGAVLLQLGDCDARRGEGAEASAKYGQALEIFRAAGSKQGEGRALTRLGTLLSDRGESTQAREVQGQALAIARAQGNVQGEVSALMNLGRTEGRAGDRPAARALLTGALALSRGAGAGFGEIKILGELARVERDDGAVSQALATLDGAIRKVEADQRRALVPSLKATISSDAAPLYAARIEILMRRHGTAPGDGWDVKAFEAAERARARALLSTLAESSADIRKGVSPALLDEYRGLQVKLASAGEADIPELRSRLHLVEAKIRTSSPGYASLIDPEPLSVAAIRKRVLDADTVLLEIALGEERSWLWALTRDRLVSAPLPPAEELERAARTLYKHWSAAPARDGAAASEQAAAQLGRMLLGPVAERLRGEWRGRRLAIVASGALDFIPFGALPVPDAPGASPAGGARLIDDHEIVNLPSASALDLIRREVDGRRAAPKRLAVIGDPVFAADDPRVRRGGPQPAGAAAPVPSDPVSQAALVAGGARGFARLPSSRDEVRAIAALLPEGEALQAMDFRASRALALDGSLEDFRVVHIATHGLLNTAHPELSGLVLSLVDEQGRPQDGFLRLQDIYNLRLSADLVVLSACRTALGREVRGEGLVGLTRGFMYAGAPRVVASLWKVDDAATAELMTAFYRGLLRDGLRPAAALRAAQRALAANARWSAPFFWAGFALEGDWR